VGYGATKKTIAGKIDLDRTGKQKKAAQQFFCRVKEKQCSNFRSAKFFVVHKTTAVLKCNPQGLSHTFESVMA
jgi:hypothetical protein